MAHTFSTADVWNRLKHLGFRLTSRYLLISFSPLVTTLYLCVRASSLRVEGASRHVLETIACSPSRATCIATFCNWHISDPNATFYWPLSKQQMHSHLVTFV